MIIYDYDMNCCDQFNKTIGYVGQYGTSRAIAYDITSDNNPEYYINEFHHDDGKPHMDHRIFFCPFCGARL